MPKLIKTSSSYQTRVKKGRFFSISYKKEESGIAEVIGAILLFAVLITLFTSFMVWYIPAQTSANETHYETQNKAALGNLVSDLHSPSISAGSTVSASVPLGISGSAIMSANRLTVTNTLMLRVSRKIFCPIYDSKLKYPKSFIVKISKS